MTPRTPTIAAVIAGLVVYVALPAQAEPIFGTCISCSFYETYSSALNNYAALIYDGTASSAKRLLNAAAYLWGMWVIFLYIIDKSPPYKDLLPQFIFLIGAGVALNGYQYWAGYALEPIMGTAIDWATFIAVKTGAQTGGYSGFTALIYAAESPPYAIIKPTLSLWEDAAENIARVLISIFLIALWVGVWFRIEGTLLVAYTRFLVMTAIAPFLIVCACFTYTRPLFKAGLKEMIHGGLDLVLMAIYIGLVNFVMKELQKYFPATTNGGWALERAKEWLFSGDFWNLVFTGFAFLGLHMYFKTLPALLLVTLGQNMPSGTQQLIQQVKQLVSKK